MKSAVKKDANYIWLNFEDAKTLDEHKRMVRNFEKKKAKGIYDFTTVNSYLGASYGNGNVSIIIEVNNNRKQNFPKEKMVKIYNSMLSEKN